MGIQRALGKTAFLATLVVGGSGGLFWYYTQLGPQHQIAMLEEKNRELAAIVERLKAERRVAKLVVTDQKTDASGAVKTTCLFAEYSRDGRSTLTPKVFTIEGKELHIDAERITFDSKFVEEGDALRGQSIVLFRRAYGGKQAPADGFALETPGDVPAFYRGTEPQVSAYEQQLWGESWEMFNDPDRAKAAGVRVANGDGKWMDVEPDKLYVFTVQADGGVNVTPEPVDPIVREWIKHLKG